GTIHGVIHAAGITGEQELCPISDTDSTFISSHFIPKICGLYVLEKTLKEINIDFYMLVSSLAATLGGLGTTAYGSANIFMDHYAQMRSKNSEDAAQFWLTVNWDGSATDEETVEAFARLWGEVTVPQIISCTNGFEESLKRWITTISDYGKKELIFRDKGIRNDHKRPKLKNVYVAPTNELEEKIAEIWGYVLGIKQVGIYDNFFELGGDSLLGTQLIARLRSAFQIDVPLKSLFETLNIANQAILIEELLIRLIEEMDEKEVTRILEFE
ncbi:KR domain-containing protein, partial [Bacillus wiedmannii]|uniref:KR domain-containing protein n=1 Tax=Bacillus wiedmannii TaxID=1890302 RepID=UPI000BFB0317